MTRFLRRHLPPAALFLALAVAWTWPLVLHLSTHISGEPGDNLAFLWNLWWMRESLSAGVPFFHTDRLFAPFGIDLTLHTHTALSAWMAGTVLAALPTVAAQNVVNLAALTLNGWAAYLLAWDRTRNRAASIVAGLVFAGSPYIAGHLLGHFNLISAWGLPLFLLCLLRALERRSLTWSAAAGLCVVAVAYTDYYYLVYCLLLALGLSFASAIRSRIALRTTPLRAMFRTILLLLLTVDLLIILAILSTGGFVTTVWGIRIVATRVTNPLAVAWIIGLLWWFLRFRPRLVPHEPSGPSVAQRVRTLLPMAAVALVGMAPLLSLGWSLMMRGDYAAPQPSWRSGPSGVDLATLVLGNPSHPLLGRWTLRAYSWLGINRVEAVGWLGVVPSMLLAWCARRRAADREVRRWLLVGGSFLVCSLGPWLHVAGVDTGLLLPQQVMAFMPILSNTRIPGRAMAVAVLALGVLAALALTELSKQYRAAALVAAVLIVVDYLPAPFPMAAIEVPPMYASLRNLEGGAVCELPMGIRDGLGMTGTFDDRVLIYQMVHRHPIVGGFAARVPESIKTGYAASPVLRSFLTLSEGKEANEADARMTRTQTADALRGQTVRFIVLNRDRASDALVAFVERSVPLRLLAKEGGRELYQITFPGPGPS